MGKRITKDYEVNVEAVKRAPLEQHGWAHLLPDSYDAETSVNIPGKGWMNVSLTPVARALDAFCAETGRSWTDHDAQYGLGEIACPNGQ